jgi:hypothetical protein
MVQAHDCPQVIMGGSTGVPVPWQLSLQAFMPQVTLPLVHSSLKGALWFMQSSAQVPVAEQSTVMPWHEPSVAVASHVTSHG